MLDVYVMLAGLQMCRKAQIVLLIWLPSVKPLEARSAPPQTAPGRVSAVWPAPIYRHAPKSCSPRPLEDQVALPPLMRLKTSLECPSHAGGQLA